MPAPSYDGNPVVGAQDVSTFTPPCGCEICQHQFYQLEAQQRRRRWQYTGRQTTKEATVLARSRAKAISRLRDTLQKLISSNGDTILKRWRRLTQLQRRDRIKCVWPDIYGDEDLTLLTQFQKFSLMEARGLRKAYLLPYINAESLSADFSRLISLLHYRTAAEPEEWVAFDNQQLDLGWVSGSWSSHLSMIVWSCTVIYMVNG